MDTKKEWTLEHVTSVLVTLHEYNLDMESNLSGELSGDIEEKDRRLEQSWQSNLSPNREAEPEEYIMQVSRSLAEAYISGSGSYLGENFSLENKFAAAYFSALSMLRNDEGERPAIYEAILLVEKLRGEYEKKPRAEIIKSLNILYSAIETFSLKSDKEVLTAAIARTAKLHSISTTLNTSVIQPTRTKKASPSITVNQYISKQMEIIFSAINFPYDEITWRLSADSSQWATVKKFRKESESLRPMEDLMRELGNRDFRIEAGPIRKEQAVKLIEFLEKHPDQISNYLIVQEGDAYRIKVSIDVINNALAIIRKEKYGLLEAIPPTRPAPVRTKTMAELAATAKAAPDLAQALMTGPDYAAGVIKNPELSQGINMTNVELMMVGTVLATINLLMSKKEDVDAIKLGKFGLDVGRVGFDVATKFAGNAISTALHHVPLGSLLYAVRLAAEEASFAQTWKKGREALQNARVKLGDSISTIIHLDQAIQSRLKQQIDYFTGHGDLENAAKFTALSNYIRKQNEAEIHKLLKGTARINAQQQIISTNRHLGRVVTGITTGLGTGAIFLPPLMVVAAAVGISSGLLLKLVGEDLVKAAVERVQGIAELDNTVLVSLEKKVKQQAIKKIANSDEIQLRYMPISMVPFDEKKDITTLLGDTVSYNLQLEAMLLFDPLTPDCSDEDIERQVLAFRICCNNISAHLNDLLIRDKNLHLPEIRNLDEIHSVMYQWQANLRKRILNRSEKYRNEGKTVPKQLDEDLSLIAKDYFSYSGLNATYEERKVFSIDDPSFKDLKYHMNMHKAYIDEMLSLADFIANHMSPAKKLIVGADELLANLEQRLNGFYTELEAARHQLQDDNYGRDYEANLLEHFRMLAEVVEESNKAALVVVQPSLNAVDTPLIIAPGLDRPLKEDEILLPLHRYRGSEIREKAHQGILKAIAILAPIENGPVRLYLAPTSELKERDLPSNSSSTQIDLHLRGMQRSIENLVFYLESKPEDVEIANGKELLDFYRQQLELFDKFAQKSKGTFFDNNRVAKINQLLDRCSELLPASQEVSQPEKPVIDVRNRNF